MEYIKSKSVEKELGITSGTFSEWIKKHDFKKHRVTLTGNKGFYFPAYIVERIVEKHTQRHERIATGMVFGRLTVSGKPSFFIKEEKDGKKKKRWLFPCTCSCGKPITVVMTSLLNGDTRSCGCLRREMLIAMQPQAREKSMSVIVKHGGARTGNNRLYNIWYGMLQRCYKPKCISFRFYGQRGIDVCEDWHDFITFRAWATSHGYTEKLTIERIDFDLGYSPENCTWILLADQNNNRRSCILIEAFGEEKNIRQWSVDPRCKVCYDTLHHRIQKLFWDPERAITEPVRFTSVRWD